MASILGRTISGRVYSYFQRSWRAKETPGKTNRTGPSKVMTKQIYLGSAEDILQKIQANQSPKEAILAWGPQKAERRLTACSSIQRDLITALGIAYLAPSG